MQQRKSLAAAVGSACAIALFTCVPQFEGTVLKGYKDPIGIVTDCTGNTNQAVLGKVYTPQECERILETDLVDHAVGVEKCVPGFEALPVGQRVAAISFAFNVGVRKFCKSGFARKLTAHAKDACAELSKWILAGGRPLPGLVRRRATERAICEGKTNV
jgi:lysozyme